MIGKAKNRAQILNRRLFSTQAVLLSFLAVATGLTHAHAASTERVPLAVYLADNQRFVLDASGLALEGSASYQWQIVSRPAGSTATIGNPAVPVSRFAADQPGEYVITLQVSDDSGALPLKTLVVSTDNVAPVASIAVIGGASPVFTGSSLSLSGASSVDPDGSGLVYQWSVTSAPAGSTAGIANSLAARTMFVPDLDGDYEISLTVTDASGASATDTLSVSTGSGIVNADAGPDRSVAAGEQVLVDAFGSTSSASLPLTTNWQITHAPTGSSAALVDGSSLDPAQPGRFALTPDAEGTYLLSLHVAGGGVNDTDTVVVNVGAAANTAPVADAGRAITISAGESVFLNGTGSTDADGNGLGYKWSILSAPAGSSPVLGDSANPLASLVTDIAGDYLVQLAVSDGLRAGFDTVLITTDAIGPVANAGPDAVLPADILASLDASATVSGTSADTPAYLWSILGLGSVSAADIGVIADPASISTTVNFAIDPSAYYNPASALGDYDFIVFENANSRSDVGGRTFIGGHLNGQSSSFGTDLSGNVGGDVILTVGNQINGKPKNVENGGSVLAGEEPNARINLNGGGTVTVDPSVSIAAVRGEMEALSSALKSRTPTAAVTLPAGSSAPVIFSSIPGADGIAVFDIADGDDLFDNNKVQSIDLELNGAEAVVINVGGNNVKINKANFTGSINSDFVRSRVIWNFYEAVNIQTNRHVSGSILAPHAMVQNRSPVYGAVVARAANQKAAIALPGFAGFAAFADTPDPIDAAVLQVLVAQAPFTDTDTVLVTNANIAPVARIAAPSSVVNVGDIVTLDALASTDANGDGLTHGWAIIHKPQASSSVISGTGDTVTFSPDRSGMYIVQLAVSDGMLVSDPVTIAIDTANQQPVITSVPVTDATVANEYSYQATGTDPDGDQLSWNVTNGPDGLGIDLASGLVSWTPLEPGNFDVTIRVEDGFGGAAEQSFTVTVAPNSAINPPEVSAIADVTLKPGQSVSFAVTATDIDGDTLTYWSSDLPDGATLDTTTGLFSYTAPDAAPAVLPVTITVTDGILTASQGFTITLEPWPDTDPTLLSGVVLDGTDLAQGITTPVIGATVTINGNAVTTGADGSFAYSALDAAGLGLQSVTVDGTTATQPTDGSAYGSTSQLVTIYKNAPNAIAEPILLSRLTEPVNITEVNEALPANLRSCRIDELQSLDGSMIDLSGLALNANDPVAPGTVMSIWGRAPSASAWELTGTATAAADGTTLENVIGTVVSGTRIMVAPLAPGGAESNLQPKDSYVPSLLGEGNLATGFSLPSYQSLGQNRAPSFIYNSVTANPRPIITADITIPAATALTATLEAELWVGGQKVPGITVTDLTQSENPDAVLPTEDETATASISVSFDASAFATGIYDYKLYVFAGHACSAAAARVEGNVFVNNRSDSPYGTGWKPSELQRIFPQDDGSLLVEEPGGGLSHFEAKTETEDFNALTLRYEADGGITPAVADFNLDGLADFAFTESATGNIRVFLNNGRRNFVEQAPVHAFKAIEPPADPSVPYFPGSTDLIIGDLNADGVPDLVAVRQGGSPAHDNKKGLAIAYGNRGGNFQTPETLNGSAQYINALIADLDGNEFPDIATTKIAAFNFTQPVLIHDVSNGNISEIGTFNSQSRATGISAYDLDGDGDLDIVLNGLFVFINNGGVLEKTSDKLFAVPTAGTVNEFGQFLDIAQNRHNNSILGASISLNTVDVGRYNPVKRRFEVYYTHTFSEAQQNPGSVRFSDLNADGRPDLLFQIGTTANSVFVAYHDETEGYNDPVPFNIPHAMENSRFSDFDGDGIVDMLTLNRFEAFVDYGNPGEQRLKSPFGDFTNIERLAGGGFTRRYKDGTVVTFNADGYQTSIADANGNTTAYAYDADGRLSSVTDAAGLVTSYAYADGRLATITDPDGRVTAFTYDTHGNMEQVTYPDQATFAFAYDEQLRLSAETDQRGQITNHLYDPTGRLTGTVAPDGGTVKMEIARSLGLAQFGVDLGAPAESVFVAPEDRVTSLEDAKGNQSEQEVNEWGAVIRTTDPIGRTTRYIRNTNNLVERIVAPSSVTPDNTLATIIRYGLSGNIIEKTEAAGTPLARSTLYEYEPEFSRVTGMTDPEGFATAYTYDGNGNQLTVTHPDGAVESRSYNAAGQVLTMTDPRGKVTGYAYDALGRLQTVTDPAGTETKMAYDGRGNPLVESVADGLAEEQAVFKTFDSLNRLLTETNGEGEQTAYAYDPAGNVLAVTDATGIAAARAYDDKGRVASVADPASGTTATAYDLNDNLTKVTAADGTETAIDYDTVNRVTQSTDALGITRRVAYDDRDNVIAVTDGRGNTTTFAYDALDRVISRTNPVGNTWRFEYDKRDLRTAIIKPDGSRITPRYDERGRLIFTGGGGTATERRYEYDPSGNLTLARSSAGKYVLGYDDRDLLSSINRPTTFVTFFIRSEYDALGRRTVMRTPNAETLYTWDKANRLISVTAPSGKLIAISHDDAGRRTGIAFPNGLHAKASFDTPASGTGTTGRLTSIAHGLDASGSGGSALDLKLGRFDYSYDVKGNITGIAETGSSSRTRSYQLDAIERLVRVGDDLAASGNTLEAYTLDEEGNRITASGSAIADSSFHVTDPANRLTEDESHVFEYDVNGNLIRKTVKSSGLTWRYAYTLYDELSRASLHDSADPAAPEVSWSAWSYNAFGERSGAQHSDGREALYYYDNGNMVAETDTWLSNVVRWYTHSDATDDILAVTTPVTLGGSRGHSVPGTDSWYYHTDHQGSVRALTDDTGAVVNEYSYTAYGQTETAVEAVPQPFRFTAREYDPETGLMHYRARAYDPATGRFLQEDPIWFEAGDLNIYRYTWNNPGNWTDPSGLNAASDYGRLSWITGSAIVAALAIDSSPVGGKHFKSAAEAAARAASDVGGSLAGWLMAGAAATIDWAGKYAAGEAGQLEGFMITGKSYEIMAVYSTVAGGGTGTGTGTGEGAGTGVGAGTGGGEDPRCQKLRKSIENKRSQIRKREQELLDDEGELPEFGPGPNYTTRQGHRRIIKKLWNHLRRDENEYYEKCVK